MSLKAFTYGNNKVEAVETSRVALEKMEREIRQAYVYNRPSDMHLFDQWTATEIRFGNDLDGNRDIACPNTSVPAKCEKIGYRLNGTTLGRDNTSTGPTNTVANLQPVAQNVQSLTFTYYNQKRRRGGSRGYRGDRPNGRELHRQSSGKSSSLRGSRHSQPCHPDAY